MSGADRYVFGISVCKLLILQFVDITLFEADEQERTSQKALL